MAQIKVIYKKTGQTGMMPEENFDESLFERVSLPSSPQQVTLNNSNSSQSVSPERSMLSKVGSGTLGLIKNVFKPLKRLGSSLGETASMADPVNRIMETQSNQNTEKMADRLSTKAVELTKEGRAEEAAKLEAMSQEMLSNLAAGKQSKGEKMSQLEEDAVKGGVGTAAFFVPGGKSAPGAVNALTRIASPTLSGAMSGFGSSEKGQEMESTVGGAAIGLGFGLGGELLSKAVNKVRGNKITVGDDLQKTIKVVGKKAPKGVTAFNKTKDFDDAFVEFGLQGKNAKDASQTINQMYDDANTKIAAEFMDNPQSYGVDDFNEFLNRKITGVIKGSPARMRALNDELVMLNDEMVDGALSNQSLYDFKNQLAGKLSRAFRKVAGELDSNLTKQEEAQLWLWSNIDELITAKNPSVKELTLLQSKLHNIAPFIDEAMVGKGPYVNLLGVGGRVPNGLVQPVKNIAGKTINTTKSGLGSITDATSKFMSQGGKNLVVGGVTSTLSQPPKDNTLPSLPEDALLGDSQEVSTPTSTVTGFTMEELLQARARTLQEPSPHQAAWLRQIDELIATEQAHQDMVSPKGGKLSEGDKKFALAEQESDKALNLLNTKNIKTGKLQKPLSNVKTFIGNEDPDVIKFRQQLATARTAARNALLGANMSDKEIESYLDAVFDFSDQPSVMKAKLEGFVQSMKDYRTNIASPTPSPTAI